MIDDCGREGGGGVEEGAIGDHEFDLMWLHTRLRENFFYCCEAQLQAKSRGRKAEVMSTYQGLANK